MAGINTPSGEQIHEVGAILGYVLYHTLQGHCFTDHSLPEESFFVDYIMDRLGTENFTVQGKYAYTQKKPHKDLYMCNHSNLFKVKLQKTVNPECFLACVCCRLESSHEEPEHRA